MKKIPRDTIHRIAIYLEGVAKKPFKINDILYTPPRKLVISSSFFRDYSCPAFCGGCCRWVSLIFFQCDVFRFLEKYPLLKEKLFESSIKVNNQEKKIFCLESPFSEEKRIRKNGNEILYDKCFYLKEEDKRCLIHTQTPFACRFSLKNVIIDKINNRAILIKKLPGRPWNINPPKGAFCKMLPFNLEKYDEDIRDIQELKEIADELGIETHLRKILDVLKKMREKLKKGKIPKNGMFLVAINKNLTIK